MGKAVVVVMWPCSPFSALRNMVDIQVIKLYQSLEQASLSVFAVRASVQTSVRVERQVYLNVKCLHQQLHEELQAPQDVLGGMTDVERSPVDLHVEPLAARQPDSEVRLWHSLSLQPLHELQRMGERRQDVIAVEVERDEVEVEVGPQAVVAAY